jgi:hypothetical protein
MPKLYGTVFSLCSFYCKYHFSQGSASNLFLHIIISCYMALFESIKKPKLIGKCRKCTGQDYPYARCIGSAIFRTLAAYNLFLHIIISYYMALFESIKMPKLTGKCRKCTEQDSSYVHCIGSTIIRWVSAWNMFLHIIISHTKTRSERMKQPTLVGACT